MAKSVYITMTFRIEFSFCIFYEIFNIQATMNVPTSTLNYLSHSNILWPKFWKKFLLTFHVLNIHNNNSLASNAFGYISDYFVDEEKSFLKILRKRKSC